MNLGRSGGRRVWRETSIPDAQPPVHVQSLHLDPLSKAATLLVRFPSGWQRPYAGHYLVDEEVLVLEDSFEMSGVRYTAGTYAYLPAGYLRDGSTSRGGALALGWFSGRPEWVRGPSPTTARVPVAVRDWTVLPRAQPPIAGSETGRLLRSHVSGDSWILDRSPSGPSPRSEVVDLFSLVDYTWLRVSPGEAIPHLAAPVFCRFRVKVD